MKTYKITEQKDGQKKVTYKSGMTLNEAQAEMLKMANHDLNKNFPNWGLVVAFGHKNNDFDFYAQSCPDGTRYYNYDVYYYKIEEED